MYVFVAVRNMDKMRIACFEGDHPIDYLSKATKISGYVEQVKLILSTNAYGNKTSLFLQCVFKTWKFFLDQIVGQLVEDVNHYLPNSKLIYQVIN